MNSEISIRKIQKEDLSGLKELYKDAFNSETDYDKMVQVHRMIDNNENYILLCA